MDNVIVTGTSSGFGHLSATAFAEQGYRVWATIAQMVEADGKVDVLIGLTDVLERP